jgi:hypothetical protein
MEMATLIEQQTDWRDARSDPPPDGEVVMTKIDDADGCRNEQPLKRMGRLWFFPDASMYVYYTPTHWKRC